MKTRSIFLPPFINQENEMNQCPFSRHQHQNPGQAVSRRDFLHGLGVAAAGLAVASCAPKSANPSSSGAKGQPIVGIAKADSYDPKLVKKQVQKILDEIGGVADVLAHGKRVAIKVNLTGGTGTKPLPGTKEIETYLTHPTVVLALIELLRDAGAKDIFIVEAAYQKESWPAYGFTDMAKAAGATIVDLSYPEPYKDFTKVTPGTNPMIYDNYVFNPILTEIDAFVSISKMKCHNTAGVTHTMKNLFGTVPCRFYTLDPKDDWSWRSAFHGQATETRERLPKIIVDLNRARPINLSLIDGIMSSDAGEGPWIQAFTPINPGLLFAGKNPVATDAVATAAMGFDPTADYPDEPFVHANNHLNLAASLGLGTNKLDEIKVVGESIKDVTTKFKTSY
jgi:uncharacterized protein (DUF362 family)